MTVIELIASMGPVKFAKSAGLSRCFATLVRDRKRSLSIRALARVAGRFEHLDLRKSLAELAPEEFAAGIASADVSSALPHTPEQQSEVA